MNVSSPVAAPLRTLLSLATADALGAATEFKTPAAIHARYGDTFTQYQPGSVFGFAPGEATDDTQMTVAGLLGYARRSGPEGVLAALSEWLATGPPDVGGLTREALQFGTLDGGMLAWTDSGFRSAGNGGLMRVAAAWIAGFRGEALARESVILTGLTHADPRCLHASVFLTAFMEALAEGQAYAQAARAALKVMDATRPDAVMLDAGLLGTRTLPGHAAWREQDRAARAAVRSSVQAALDGRADSQSGFVLDTLQSAVVHAAAPSWMDGVQAAVMLGDDSDTVACVTGAVVGARGLPVPDHLLPDLRIGHTWPGWDRTWAATERLPAIVVQAQVA